MGFGIGTIVSAGIKAAGTGKDDDDTGGGGGLDAIGSAIKRLIRKHQTKDAGAGDLADVVADPASAKKGGMVKKTGKATIHKGERVLTKRQAKKYNKGPRKRA